MAGARATLGIVRGGTGTDVSVSERSERWGRAQRDGSGRPARSRCRPGPRRKGTQPDQELIPAGQGGPPQNPPTAAAGGKSP